jgi:hypothetical protein
MPARRLANERDAVHIDFVVRRMRLHPPDRRRHILSARRPAMLRREPVIDREPREARLRQRLKQRRDERMLVPLREPAAMHQNARRKRPAALRHERVQRQRHIPRFREFNVLLQAGHGERFWIGGVERDGEQDREEAKAFHQRKEGEESK